MEYLGKLKLPVKESVPRGQIIDDIEPGEAIREFEGRIHAHPDWKLILVLL